MFAENKNYIEIMSEEEYKKLSMDDKKALGETGRF